MNLLWKLLAKILSRPIVANWLIRRAQRTPYTPIMSRDGTTIYMERLWLFNGYGKDERGEQTPAPWPRLPSIRVHKIMRADDDEHEHNHPWPSRSLIMKDFYGEQRAKEFEGTRLRKAGDTVALTVDTFHRIDYVPPQGVYTLFITWGDSRGWGFDVDGSTVPWREYLAARETPAAPARRASMATAPAPGPAFIGQAPAPTPSPSPSQDLVIPASWGSPFHPMHDTPAPAPSFFSGGGGDFGGGGASADWGSSGGSDGGGSYDSSPSYSSSD